MDASIEIKCVAPLQMHQLRSQLNTETVRADILCSNLEDSQETIDRHVQRRAAAQPLQRRCHALLCCTCFLGSWGSRSGTNLLLHDTSRCLAQQCWILLVATSFSRNSAAARCFLIILWAARSAPWLCTPCSSCCTRSRTEVSVQLILPEDLLVS